MATKCTYMYRISMGYGNDIKEVVYAYGRNKQAVREGCRMIFKEKKYDKFDVVMFGEADYRKHPERFMPMPKDEVDYVIRANLGQADAYSQRKAEPPKVEFIPESEEA